MLFHSSLRKELSRSFGATLVVLVTIVMTMMLIRTLGLASKGSVNPQEVFLVMAYTVLGYMPTILSLSLFVAIVGTLSRMYRDSEMVIWFSSGRGLMDFVKPMFRFAWPVLILMAVMALVGWPWANSQTIGMRQQYEQRSDIERVAPGEFRESAGACGCSSSTRTRRTTPRPPTSSSGRSSATCRSPRRRAAAASRTSATRATCCSTAASGSSSRWPTPA
jgi:lipopolysaccharide export system permease protein